MRYYNKALKIDWVKGKNIAKELLGKVAAVPKALASDAKKTCAMLAGKAGPLPARLSQGLASIRLLAAAEKKRPVLFIAGGLAALLLVLAVAALALNSRGPRESAPAGMRAAHAIPSEELFIPDEPDFLPPFLLEREPRHFWSVEDIRPYWRSPGNPEFWQGVIRSAVDELMENVP